MSGQDQAMIGLGSFKKGGGGKNFGIFDAFLNFSNRGCNVPTTGEDMARSKLLRIGRISQDHPSRVPKHPRSFDLFQRWQRQRANLIQFFFFMMTTIWSRTAISKAPQNLTLLIWRVYSTHSGHYKYKICIFLRCLPNPANTSYGKLSNTTQRIFSIRGVPPLPFPPSPLSSI